MISLLLIQYFGQRPLSRKTCTSMSTALSLFHHLVQEVFHVYLNKFENAATHLFLVILGNN